jgi:lipopolysaccharide/colanic/teichoic acid biosynthesis glycosyltransferase
MAGDIVPYRAVKRVLDKALSSALLLLASPLLAAVLVAMGLEMLATASARGPWLYRERRMTQGREFDLLKFRVLRRGAVEKAHDEGQSRTHEADPANLTWTGRRLLKPWYLDELPQLLNILRGDMSLVGPRPWPLAMVREQAAAGDDYRMRVMAGWTGPAQVQKGRPDPAEGAEFDLAYADACRTWSAWRLARYDLGILWQTIGTLRRGEGLRY